MNLVEKWRSSEHDDCDVREGLGIAADDLENACTPQPPKAEWFGAPFDGDGKPTGKWDAWWVEDDTCAQGICRDVVELTDMIHDDKMTACAPVAREGFPAPVGWAVVGG